MDKYIDCDAALEIIRERQKELCFPGLYGRSYAKDKEAYDTFEEVLDAISAIPAADVAPVQHGRWINRHGPDEDMNVTDVCSECGHTDTHSTTVEVPHCWFCGAEMTEYKEEK